MHRLLTSAWPTTSEDWAAAQWMRNERIAQAFDSRATVRPKFVPKLPDGNVLQFRRKA